MSIKGKQTKGKRVTNHTKGMGWSLMGCNSRHIRGKGHEVMFYSMYVYYLLRFVTFLDTVILALRKVRSMTVLKKRHRKSDRRVCIRRKALRFSTGTRTWLSS